MNITIKHTQTTETTETIKLPHYRKGTSGTKMIAIFSESDAIEVNHWQAVNSMYIESVNPDRISRLFENSEEATEDEYTAFMDAYTAAHHKLLVRITELEDAAGGQTEEEVMAEVQQSNEYQAMLRQEIGG